MEFNFLQVDLHTHTDQSVHHSLAHSLLIDFIKFIKILNNRIKIECTGESFNLINQCKSFMSRAML